MDGHMASVVKFVVICQRENRKINWKNAVFDFYGEKYQAHGHRTYLNKYVKKHVFTVENDVLLAASFDGSRQLPVLLEDDFEAVFARIHGSRHTGIVDTIRLLQEAYALVNTQYVREVVASCATCNAYKANTTKGVHAHPIIVNNRFERMGMDITDLQICDQTYPVLTRIDFFSRFAHADVIHARSVTVSSTFA